MSSPLEVGYDLYDRGRSDLAVGMFERAIAQDPGSSIAHMALSSALVKIGDLDRARSEAEVAVALDPEESMSHASLGIALGALGARRRGIAELREAIRLDPHNADFFGALALLHLQSGRPAEAEKAAREGLALEPQHSICLDYLAAAMLDRGRQHEVAPIVQASLELDPGNARFHASLGELEHQLGHVSDARASTLEALRLDPAWVDAQRQLTRIGAEDEGLAWRALMRWLNWWQRQHPLARIATLAIPALMAFAPTVPGWIVLLVLAFLALHLAVNGADWLEQRLELRFLARTHPVLRPFSSTWVTGGALFVGILLIGSALLGAIR
jgi:predicted Zn-dependent protease